jgi:hypothetical protein
VNVLVQNTYSVGCYLIFDVVYTTQRPIKIICKRGNMEVEREVSSN